MFSQASVILSTGGWGGWGGGGHAWQGVCVVVEGMRGRGHA